MVSAGGLRETARDRCGPIPRGGSETSRPLADRQRLVAKACVGRSTERPSRPAGRRWKAGNCRFPSDVRPRRRSNQSTISSRATTRTGGAVPSVRPNGNAVEMDSSKFRPSLTITTSSERPRGFRCPFVDHRSLLGRMRFDRPPVTRRTQRRSSFRPEFRSHRCPTPYRAISVPGVEDGERSHPWSPLRCRSRSGPMFVPIRERPLPGSTVVHVWWMSRETGPGVGGSVCFVTGPAPAFDGPSRPPLWLSLSLSLLLSRVLCFERPSGTRLDSQETNKLIRAISFRAPVED